MRALALLLALLATSQTAASDCAPGHDLDDQALLRAHLPITGQKRVADLLGRREVTLGAVRIFRQNVFPDAEHWLARGANRFNTLTRESVIRAALPFGKTVGARQIEEAERILRDKPFLYDAAILVRTLCGDRVDLDVVVRDVWTLNPSLDYSRSGGDNRTGIGLTDVNLLGIGKLLAFTYRSDADRDTLVARYFEPNMLGSRWSADLQASQQDDGERGLVAVSRPFFALDARWSLGFMAEHFRRQQDLEILSEDIAEFDASTQRARLHVGWSGGRRGASVDRLFAGVGYLKERFEFPQTVAPNPTQRRYVYPFVGWQHISDRFVERTNLFRVGVVEDIDVGVQSYLELGYAPSDGGTWLLRGEATANWLPFERHLVRSALDIEGRHGAGGTEDLVVAAEFTHVWSLAERWRWISSARLAATRNLPLERQLMLGGDTDLRGYPSRYQAGDHRYLASVEARYLPDIFPWRLFRVGVAAFYDVGRAWFEEAPPAYLPDLRGDHYGTLRNVGLGLRIESVRTRRDRVIAIDLAKPLVDGPEIDGMELTVTIRGAF